MQDGAVAVAHALAGCLHQLKSALLIWHSDLLGDSERKSNGMIGLSVATEHSELTDMLTSTNSQGT